MTTLNYFPLSSPASSIGCIVGNNNASWIDVVMASTGDTYISHNTVFLRVDIYDNYDSEDPPNYIDTTFILYRSFIHIFNPLNVIKPKEAILHLWINFAYGIGNIYSDTIYVVANNITLDGTLSNSDYSNINKSSVYGTARVTASGAYTSINFTTAGINYINGGGVLSFALISKADYDNYNPYEETVSMGIDLTKSYIELKYDSVKKVNGVLINASNKVINKKAKKITNVLAQDIVVPALIILKNVYEGYIEWEPSYDLFKLKEYRIYINDVLFDTIGPLNYFYYFSVGLPYSGYINSIDEAGNVSENTFFYSTLNNDVGGSRTNVSNARISTPCTTSSSVWLDNVDNLIYTDEEGGLPFTGTFYQYTSYNAGNSPDIYGYNTVSVSSGVYSSTGTTWTDCYPS